LYITLLFKDDIFPWTGVYYITPTGNAGSDFHFSSLPSSGLIPERMPYFVKNYSRCFKGANLRVFM